MELNQLYPKRISKTKPNKPVLILGIESSCDDTSAAVICDGELLSNVIANQDVHASYGGVVPELASRAHQINIVPVVQQALCMAQIEKEQLSAVAFTRGPGLLGSLLVGTSFAKGLSQALDIPLIEVNHLQAHVLVPFIKNNNQIQAPFSFPYLCLLVSGGNSQILLVKHYDDIEIIGRTIDDAAGEAFDKCAKVMGLPYPGGPHVDRLAQLGSADIFRLNKPNIPNYDYSFSGLKTSFLYLVRDKIAANKDFINENINDLCASVQASVVEILMKKLKKAAIAFNIKSIALAGGVSANSALRNAVQKEALLHAWKVYIPPIEFTTDNAAMVANVGYMKYLNSDFCSFDKLPYSRVGAEK